MARQQFVCVRCGLQLAGRLGADGKIRASDRSPTRFEPGTALCLCAECADRARQEALRQYREPLLKSRLPEETKEDES